MVRTSEYIYKLCLMLQYVCVFRCNIVVVALVSGARNTYSYCTYKKRHSKNKERPPFCPHHGRQHYEHILLQGWYRLFCSVRYQYLTIREQEWSQLGAEIFETSSAIVNTEREAFDSLRSDVSQPSDIVPTTYESQFTLGQRPRN